MKKGDEQGQRRTMKGAANSVALGPPLAVASIFLTKEQRRRQKEGVHRVAEVDGQPEFDKQGGAPAKEGTPCRESLDFTQTGVVNEGGPLKAIAEVKAGVGDPSSRLAPLFLPKKTRVLKEKCFSKEHETQVNPANVGPPGAGKGTKRKRVEKGGAELVVVENEVTPKDDGEAEREPQNGSFEAPRNYAADANLIEVAEPHSRPGLPESDTLPAGGAKGKMEMVTVENLPIMGGFVEDGKPLNAAGEEGNLEDAMAEKSTGKEARGSAGVVEGVGAAGPVTPAKRKRGRPKKATLSEAPEGKQGASKRLGESRKGIAAAFDENAIPLRQADEGQAEPVVRQGQVETDPDRGMPPPVTKTQAPSQGASLEKQETQREVGGGLQHTENQLLSASLRGAGQSVKAAVDAGAQQTVMKVPDIFLTANERKRRLQETKKEEKRLQEEAAAAAEQARLEKESLLRQAKEDKKREAEEKRQRAREEKAKQAEEKKRLAREEKAKGAEEKKAGKEKKVGGPSGEGRSRMENGHDADDEIAEGGTPAKKKRGRPWKNKIETETGPDVVVLLSGSEKEEPREAPSLLETMRKRQEDLRASIRESQEAHAKLNAGKATHPFFKRKQGPPADDVTPAAMEAAPAKDSKPSLAPLDPLHVTQRHEEDAPPVLWPERQLRSSKTSPSNARLETHAPLSLLEPAHPGTSRSRVPGCETGLSLAQRQESVLGALLGFVQAKTQGEGSEEASEVVRQLTTEEALRRRFEWYQARAAAAQPDEKEPGVDTVSPDVSGAPLTDALWCFKYRPLSSQEVCGNADGVAFIREWLAEWTARIAREQKKKLLTSQPAPKPKAAAKKWQASEESSDWLVSGGASDSDLRDDEDGLANVLLLSGPTGVGKTATVYALAEELGFHILESNPSEKRSRATILQRFGEATESKGLLKGNTTLGGKSDGAKPSNALLETLRNSATAKAVAHQPKAAAAKRNTRKRPNVAGGLSAANKGGPGPSESEISAFVGSESSGSFGARGKGRKRRRKGEAAAIATGGENRPVASGTQADVGRVEEAAFGTGELAGAKRPCKRRKRVGFVGLGESEPEEEGKVLGRTSELEHVAAERTSEGGHAAAPAASEGGHVATTDAHVAVAPTEGDTTPNVTGFAGPDSAEDDLPATGVEGGSRVPVGQDLEAAQKQVKEVSAEPNGERDALKEDTPAAESGEFLPAYQRRHKGLRGEEKSANGGGDAGASHGADMLKDGVISDEVEIGDRQIADVATPATEGNKKQEELESAAGHARDAAIEGETMALIPSVGVPAASVGVPAESVGRKRKTDGVQRRRTGKLPDGSPPVKKRRSFGSPAVLSKVRTRPCSPEGKQGLASIVLEGPVLDGVDTPETVPKRKRLGKRRSSLDKVANGKVAKEKNSSKGPVLAAVGVDAGGKAPAKGGPGSSKALLLFEEVEQQFEEDKGFMSAIATLAASTKRPMILTCNDSLEIPPGCDFRKLSVDFAAPPVLDLTVHACLVAASEGSPVDPWVTERLVRVTKDDMRKVLLQAQLWSRELTSADERTGVALPEPIGDVSTGVCRTKKIQIATEAPSAELGDAKAGLGAQTAVWRVGTCKEDESELDTCPEATQPRSLWPTGTVRELQLDAAHRSLPALADVALPCQLAAAVAAHQTLQTLRAAQVAERAAAVLAARVYGVLDAEEASAARLRKEIQEAKAAAKAAEKAEVAERRRLAREAKRAAQRVADEENETGGDFGEGALLDDLEDVPIGRLSFCGNEAGVSLEIAHVPGARKGRRGRRRAIEEDDDVSGGACDVTLANGPASEPDQTAGRTGGLAEALEDSHVDQACGVCGRTDGEDAMLLCDRRGCLGALHMYCADPPMAEVPEGDWFCAECLKGKENGIGRWGVNALEGGGPQERPAGGGVKETDPGGGGEEEGRVSGHEGLRTDGGNEQTMAGGGRGENRSVEGGGEGTRLSAKEEGKEQVPGDRLNVLVSKAEEVEPPGGEREADETGGVEVENNMQEAQGRVVDEEPSGQAGTGPTEGDAGYLGKPREGPVEVATPPDGHREHEQMRVNERAEAIESGFSGGGSLPGLHRPVEKGSQPEGAADVSMKGVAELRAGDVQRALVVTESGAAVAPTDAPVDAVDVASHMPGGLDRMPVLTAEATAQLADADDPRPAVLESSSDLKCAALSEQPLAKVEPLRPDEMRGLVSTASREAVTVTAAVWGLADDLSASELMSQSRGVGSGADATPCDELDLGVPRQAAACLAYASLRWKVDTCQGVTGPKGGASDLGINSTGTEPGAESEGKLDQGDGQLLAAAGDEAALCGFLSGRGGAGEPTWLRLRMGASAEQNDLNRRTVDINLREASYQEAAARRSAGLSCRMGRVEYTGFLGKMLTLEADRQRTEEGLRRSDRAIRPHLSDIDFSDELTRALMQSTRYGGHVGTH